MRDSHKKWHNHSDTGKNDVKPKRKGHLRPRCDQIVHTNAVENAEREAS